LTCGIVELNATRERKREKWERRKGKGTRVLAVEQSLASSRASFKALAQGQLVDPGTYVHTYVWWTVGN
jgi:hypothetical protein